MSFFHIDDLENAIRNNGWRITRTPGNDLDIPETWLIRKHGSVMALIFEGMGDPEVLPIEKSYACRLLENPAVSLHFSKNNKILLTLGMGVDYALFLQARQTHAHTLLATTLAALLSFGLLAFSRTPALHALGLTATLGVTLSWLLTPMLRKPAS
jgi:hypothetical protein